MSARCHRGGQKTFLGDDTEHNVDWHVDVLLTKGGGSPAKGMVHAKVLRLMGDNYQGRDGSRVGSHGNSLVYILSGFVVRLFM